MIQTAPTAEMIGAHSSKREILAVRAASSARIPAEPKAYDHSVTLTNAQVAKIAKCLGVIGRQGFIRGEADGEPFTIEMSKAGPYRELLAIFASAQP